MTMRRFVCSASACALACVTLLTMQGRQGAVSAAGAALGAGQAQAGRGGGRGGGGDAPVVGQGTLIAGAWGAEAVEMGVGGSIPFIADLVELFPAAQILVTGVEDPDSRAHSPNESLHLGVFQRAILTEAVLLARLNERV